MVAQQFFPTAERNQFVIDVWMPQGSRFEATDAVMRRIEGELLQDKLVTHLASFVGPELTAFLLQREPPAAGSGLRPVHRQYHRREGHPRPGGGHPHPPGRLAPEATVLVQELQQGDVQEAPLEYRISGDDPGPLKAIGAQVEDILRADPGAQFIHTDYLNDSPCWTSTSTPTWPTAWA